MGAKLEQIEHVGCGNLSSLSCKRKSDGLNTYRDKEDVRNVALPSSAVLPVCTDKGGRILARSPRKVLRHLFLR